ncbi:MAG: DUF835 domain-containing protein [Candidatus Thermoplasmatota archaeon]|nr:DUF835 domain-containing protein [Candidatus Thermoplasmatota archaeon]MBS3789883.1 DUF835 domain-containing protein [Candidatus Thermoplasmatota archaeon]
MKKEEKIELYLKGYKEGQKDAWSEIESLISKYEGWELRSRVESMIGTRNREVDSKRTEIKENPDILSLDKEEEPKKKVSSEKDIPWNKGDAYLFVENKLDESIEELTGVLERGASALLVLRENPEKTVDRFDIPVENCRFIWLSRSKVISDSESEIDIEKISPSDLSGLSNAIGSYLKTNRKGVVFLSGIPLMTNYNEENKVLRLLNFSRDKVTENQGCLVASISPDAFEEKFFEKIKGEFNQTYE